MVITSAGLRKLYELSHVYRDFFIKDFESGFDIPDELNKTHVRTLMYIRFADMPKMSEISGNMGLEKGSFTPVAQKLYELGYIKKNKTEKDRRKSLLELTEKGKALTDDFAKEHRDYLNKKLASLDKETAKQLTDSFEFILKTLKNIAE